MTPKSAMLLWAKIEMFSKGSKWLVPKCNFHYHFLTRKLNMKKVILCALFLLPGSTFAGSACVPSAFCSDKVADLTGLLLKCANSSDTNSDNYAICVENLKGNWSHSYGKSCNGDEVQDQCYKACKLSEPGNICLPMCANL
jgi:hypothetical protein